MVGCFDRNPNLTFPTSVYLENLTNGSRNTLNSRSTNLSDSSSSVSSCQSPKTIKLFDTRAKKTKEGENSTTGSLSSVSSLKSERTDHVLDTDLVDVHSDQTGVKNKKRFGRGAKSKSSYSITPDSLSEIGVSDVGDGIGDNELGRFRFISSEEGQDVSDRRTGETTKASSTEIHWSSNRDRLI